LTGLTGFFAFGKILSQKKKPVNPVKKHLFVKNYQPAKQTFNNILGLGQEFKPRGCCYFLRLMYNCANVTICT